MKELLKRLTKLEKEAAEAEMAYIEAPEDEAIEEAFDKAYEAEYNAYMAAANEVVKMTEGKISFNIAKTMIQTKRSELEALFA